MLIGNYIKNMLRIITLKIEKKKKKKILNIIIIKFFYEIQSFFYGFYEERDVGPRKETR